MAIKKVIIPLSTEVLSFRHEAEKNAKAAVKKLTSEGRLYELYPRTGYGVFEDIDYIIKTNPVTGSMTITGKMGNNSLLKLFHEMYSSIWIK